MDVLSFVGSSLLSTIYDMLSEKLKEYLSDQLRDSNEEVCAQMESWKTLLTKITAVLQHAEENQVANQFVKLYLDDLKDLAYDMEDILEEFVIDAKRSELSAKSEARPSKLQKIIGVFFGSRAKPNPKIDSMVNDLSGRLQKIDNGMRSLDLANLALKLEDKSKKVVAKRLPESSLLEDMVLGRDSDKQAILQRLLEDGDSLEQDFIVPIVGMGGLGKTTLTRLIYNDEKLKGRFDLKAWVCVSDVFDVARITRTILEQVTRKRCVLDDFSSLQEELKGELSGRKFFLVLDDVWNKEYGPWVVLKRPFMSGAPGSKIIVTTRNKDVGTMMRGDGGVYNLELLQDDACLPLFTRHALGKENFDVHPDLQDVGEKLVERCKRLPLALKALGGVLRGKLCRDTWENILNSDIWSLSEDRSGILPTLRLSYNDLPCHLKRCFAYCALFPKDYEFDKEELVLLWMAEGLLQQQSRGKKQMEEEIGHQYFQELLSRSLFQQSSINKSHFVMHDLINDLAVDVAGEIYCNLERSMGDEKLEKARHLSFTPNIYELSKRFRVLDKLKHLRTFLPLKVIEAPSPCNGFYLSNSLHNVLPTLNCLRVLSLRNYRVSKLLDSFENLKHMRYIDLSHSSITCIPESVGSLLFLQTLLLSDCQMLTKLPTTIGNLIDLHHLDISHTPHLKEMPSGIGNLKNLVTLSKFIVGKASGMMRLSDLKNLSQLRGKLCILDLQNVLDVQDAKEANLGKIHGLEGLVLEWTTSHYDREELVLKMQVLISRLKPHSNLKGLKISCYGGKSFPDWVCDPSLFLNLSSMELKYCWRCTSLPSLGLLPVLRKLIIEGMEAIEVVGPEFYGRSDSFQSLEELMFQNMLNWKEWTSPTGSEGKFPCLRRLVISSCPNLLGLPSNLSSLKELDVTFCEAMTCLPMSLPSLKELSIDGCNGVLLKTMVDLTSLTNLIIHNIVELTHLPMSVSLPSLKKLCIEYCNGELLKSMVDLTSLTNLRIQNIVEPTCLPISVSLPSLKELYIGHCTGVLFKSLINLTSLTHLTIQDIVELTYLPKSFTQSLIALETLDIARCNDLTCLWEEGTKIERALLPFNLKHLHLLSCRALKSLPVAMMMRMDENSSDNTSMSMSRLEKLEIWSCDSLKSFPIGKLPITLKFLKIVDCKGLKSLPDADGDNNNSNLHLEIKNVPCLYSSEGCHQLPTFLKKLRVSSCEGLESFPDRMLQHCTGLQSISIWDCKILKSLPTLNCFSNLFDLSINHCEVLESLPKELGLCTPNLKKLLILSCKNLKSLPNTMYQLKSLQLLHMQDCPSIEFIPDGGLPPNLTNLELGWCKNLKCVPNTMDQLTSLQILSIPGGVLTMGLQNLMSLRSLTIKQNFPLDIVLPSSLTCLSIGNEENLESIPGGLFQNLSSLQVLCIFDCPKLQSLPREAFPSSLVSLSIMKCLHLKRQRFEPKGDHWTLTRGIPSVKVDKFHCW